MIATLLGLTALCAVLVFASATVGVAMKSHPDSGFTGVIAFVGYAGVVLIVDASLLTAVTAGAIGVLVAATATVLIER